MNERGVRPAREALLLGILIAVVAAVLVWRTPPRVPLYAERPPGRILILNTGTPAPGELTLSLAGWTEQFTALVEHWRPGTPIWIRSDREGEAVAVAKRLRREMEWDHIQVEKGRAR